ncbi:IgGFc-binding protein-like [Heteronotia binoei]|uniref:IgGFc-binding protein-like n=1 Tax=Heteronotia binoei TaxID=13085 RepID=UPI00292EC9E8|nr:IgGFc-binding protein-like [Heteronotia binoei]
MFQASVNLLFSMRMMEFWAKICILWGMSAAPALMVVGLIPTTFASSPLGKEFAIAFMQNGLQRTSQGDFKLIISGYAPNTSVTINMERPALRAKTQVNDGQFLSVTIPHEAEMVGTDLFDNAVIVRADKDISILSVNKKPSSVDTTIVYPVTTLGTEYYIITPTVGTDRYGEFAIVAWEEPTSIDVYLKGTVTFQGKTYYRGSKISIALNPYQAVQLQSEVDVSGTKIVSQKPVAVYSGHTCITRKISCDHVSEQLLPVSGWGTNFIVPSLPFDTEHDIVYVSTSQNARVDALTGMRKSSRTVVGAQSMFYGIQGSTAMSLSASSGIQVIFFCDGGTHGHLRYDPFFMAIPPVTSYCQAYNIYGQDQFENYALIIAKSSETSGITLDKRQLRNLQWKPIPGTEFSWASHSLGSRYTVHKMEHPTSPFGLLSVGVGLEKAYGSPAICTKDPCNELQCRAKETCKVQNGQASCIPEYKGTCQVSTSHNVQTFDGLAVDLQDPCSYTVVKACSSDSNLVPFIVEEKSSNTEGDAAFKMQLTHIKVYDYNITISRGEGAQIMVNGAVASLPATLQDGKIKLSKNDGMPTIETDFGLQVMHDNNFTVVLTLPSSYYGATCGLCGNFNKERDDDMTYPNGTQASSNTDWVSSWEVPDSACSACDESQEELYSHEKYCGVISKVSGGPFRDCHSTVSPSEYFKECILEMCLNKGDKDTLQQMVEAYATACQEADITAIDWKMLYSCGMLHPVRQMNESPIPGSTLTSIQRPTGTLLYPYGTSQGDSKNEKSDDGASAGITISVPFTFYGKPYRTLYVNNNGVVSFGVRVSQFTPNPFPLDGGSPFVAPYWGDVDNVKGGDIFWRQSQDPSLLRWCTEDINRYFPGIPFAAAWAFVATWDRVAYYGSTSSKVNTFQAVLITNRRMSFIMLNYAGIQWTTGTASGGNEATGLGGTPAQAGFDSGDKTNYYTIPSSRTPDIINIGRTTNVGVPGRWVFQVDRSVVPASAERVECPL